MTITDTADTLEAALPAVLDLLDTARTQMVVAFPGGLVNTNPAPGVYVMPHDNPEYDPYRRLWDLIYALRQAVDDGTPTGILAIEGHRAHDAHDAAEQGGLCAINEHHAMTTANQDAAGQKQLFFGATRPGYE